MCKSLNVSLLFTCFFTLLANIQTSSFFEASLAPFLRMEPLSYLWMYLAREVPCTGAFLCLVTPTKAIHGWRYPGFLGTSVRGNNIATMPQGRYIHLDAHMRIADIESESQIFFNELETRKSNGMHNSEVWLSIENKYPKHSKTWLWLVC